MQKMTGILGCHLAQATPQQRGCSNARLREEACRASGHVFNRFNASVSYRGSSPGWIAAGVLILELDEFSKDYTACTRYFIKLNRIIAHSRKTMT